ncbi:YkvI family membrane protein [Corynebacterium mayonis]|uniref:YkvI family membrane protein n=1 Tax=Corynebacterium mayonis TaxID=3062461 RepID=UPI0031400203
MLKKAVGISFAFIGVVVGAGFASGQEAMQYFVAFGTQGIWGAVLGSVLMLVGGVSILQLGSYYQAKEHMEVLGSISGKVLSWVLDIATIITLFSIGFVMFAGAGSNLNQQFGLPIWVGAVVMLGLVIFFGLMDVDKVTAAIGTITPFLITFVVVSCVWTLATSDVSWAVLNEQASNVDTTLPNWWISALNYTGLNFICVSSMAIVIGGNYLDTRSAGVGGLLGGLGYLVMLMLLTFGLMSQASTVAGEDMPLLALINSLHPWFGLAMSLVLFGMIFATALGMFYALGKRLARGHENRYRLIFISTCLVGFVLSFVGFQRLVAYVYPALGYMGLVLIVTVFASWMRALQKLSAEGNRRRRALELMRIKLDPRRRFMKKDQEELAKLSKASNVPDDEFAESVEEEVGEELAEDDEVDYDPEEGGSDVMYVSYAEPVSHTEQKPGADGDQPDPTRM